MAGWVYWEAPIRNNFLWKGLIERNLLLCSSLKLKVWCTYWNFRMRFSGFQEFNLNGCSSAWKLPFPGFRNCEFLFKIKEKFAFLQGNLFLRKSEMATSVNFLACRAFPMHSYILRYVLHQFSKTSEKKTKSNSQNPIVCEQHLYMHHLFNIIRCIIWVNIMFFFFNFWNVDIRIYYLNIMSKGEW